MKSTTKYLLAASIAAAVVVSGCDPTIGGEGGNLALTYDEGPVAGATGSTPLAVGAKLDYSAYIQGDKDQKVSFVSAMSDADDVIRVDQTSGGIMTLEAVDQGAAMVDVEAEGPTGEALTDSFELEAETVDALEFKHPCAPGGEATYLVDHDIRLHYTMRADGRIAVGYGHYPVEVEPAEGATVGESTINGLLPLHTGSSPGEVTVSSTVDDSSIQLRLSEEGDIDGLNVFELDFVNDSRLPVPVDESLSLHLLPTASGLLAESQESVPVCQSDIDVQVDTSTPDICGVEYGPNELETSNIFHLYEANVLTVTGKNEGSCEINVTIPGADGGNGLTETITVDVSSSGQTDQDDQPKEG